MTTRLAKVLDGFANYGNPLSIATKRIFDRNGTMSIQDRATRIRVKAAVNSYQMFGETWYNLDYDVPCCPLRPGDQVIDIGANQGFFSCYAASKGARVWSYEPFPESCDRLRQNVEANDFEQLVTVNQNAVSNSTGTASLLCSEFLGGGGNTLIDGHALQLTSVGERFERNVQVEVVNIADILSKCPGRVRLLKLDCEGSELNIILGIVDPLKIDALALELHPGAYRTEKLIEALLSWGTHQITFTNNALILHAVRTDVVVEFAQTLT